MIIRFTRHALEKFEILQRHGIVVSKELVEETIRSPKYINHSRLPLLIAQGPLNRTLVLRVVYSAQGHGINVITFYPGRRQQYEEK